MSSLSGLMEELSSPVSSSLFALQSHTIELLFICKLHRRRDYSRKRQTEHDPMKRRKVESLVFGRDTVVGAGWLAEVVDLSSG